MINLNELQARLTLRNALMFIEQSFETKAIAYGMWNPTEGDLLPIPRNKARRDAWERLLRRSQTIGPRILNRKTQAAVGNVTWGGNNDTLDETLKKLDLEDLATKTVEDLIINGISALVAQPLHDINNNPTNTFGITRLGGYLEPISHPNDIDRIIGLYQAEPNLTGENTRLTRLTSSPFSTSNKRHETINMLTTKRWTVRVWDWSTTTTELRIWHNLNDPTRLATPPTITTNENITIPTPKLITWQRNHAGIPISEMMTITPLIKQLWTWEALTMLVGEYAGIPILKLQSHGIDQNEIEIGPGLSIPLAPTENAEWMTPGNMQQLENLRQTTLERIRDDLSLPGGFLGNDSPSGEAFREANISFRQNASRYATRASQLLTNVTHDLAELMNTEPTDVSITPNKEFGLTERIQTTIELFREGIIPLNVAVNAVQEFYSFWDDAAATAWIEQQTSTITPADFLTAAQNTNP